MSKLLVVLLVFGLVGCGQPSALYEHPPICASNGFVYSWSNYYKMYTAESSHCIPTEYVK